MLLGQLRQLDAGGERQMPDVRGVGVADDERSVARFEAEARGAERVAEEVGRGVRTRTTEVVVARMSASLPARISRPLSMMTMLSAVCSISASWWLDTRTVLPWPVR